MQTSDSLTICDAQIDDLSGLLDIYNDVIATSTAVYSDRPVTLEERIGWWRTRTAAGYPVLVARDAAGIAGFSTFGDFRTWPGYRYTVEHTVHVRADCRGRGIGRTLLEALFPRAAALGKHRRGQRGIDPLSCATRLRAVRAPARGRLQIRTLARPGSDAALDRARWQASLSSWALSCRSSRHRWQACS
jgi:L-amino acid N-acyltransferase YncA